MDMGTFSFGGINASSKKKVLSLQTSKQTVLYDALEASASYPFPVVVLTDEIYGESKLRIIRSFLEAHRITRYSIVSSLNCFISKDAIKDDQKEGIIKFYRENSSDFMKDIPSNAVIMTVGAAVYALTRGDDIYPSYCNELIFGRTHFWFSRTLNENGNWVYPIESFNDIFAEGFFSGAVDSYKTRIAEFQFKAITSRKDSAPPVYPVLNKVFVSSSEDFDLFYEAHKNSTGLMAWDIETSGFDPFEDRIGCVTVSFDGITGYYIPWQYVNKRKMNHLLANHHQLGANLKFDIKFFWRNGISAARVDEDIYPLGHIMDETRSNSLKTLAYFYSPFGGYDFELEEYKRKAKIDNYLEIPEPILREYAVLDAIVTYRCYEAMVRHVQALDKKYPNEKGTSWTIERYYREIRIPAINAYAKLEYRGVCVDPKAIKKARAKVQERINALEIELAESFGVPKFFDFNSTTEMGKLLEAKGWEALGRVKSGSYQCSDYQLERWSESHPEAKLIQELRSCRVIINTFLGDEAGTKGWSQYLKYHPEDKTWRLHPNFNVMGTESGRSRCSEPNMQNIPTHGAFAEEVKACLSTPDINEFYMVTIDYSGLQLRLAAIDSEDPVLCNLYKTNSKADVHSKTAYGVFIQGREWETEIIEVVQDGKKHVFLGGQLVNTLTRGEIFAKALTEEDTLA